MTNFLHTKLTKFLSIVLIIAHIVTFGPIRDVLAYVSESTNYRLDQAFYNEGGNTRESTTKIIEQDTVGESIAGKCQSSNYILGSGFTYYTEPNWPVLIAPIPAQFWPINISLPDAFDLDDYFQSFDENPLSYSVAGNSQIDVVINPDTSLVSFAQPSNWSGVEKIHFYATDSQYHTTPSNKVALQVENLTGPDQPVIVDMQLEPGVIEEGDLVTMTVKAMDLDGENITFAYSDLFTQTTTWQEGGFWFSQSTWQTDFDDTGHYTISITVTDPTNLTDTDSILVNVGNFNHPPVMAQIAPITANENELITITPTATDEDGDSIIFYFSSPFNSQGIWLPTYDDAGEYVVTVIAFDGIDSVYQDVNVTVNNVNRAPEAIITLNDYTVNPNQVIDVQLNALDLDGDSMTFVLLKDGEQIASGSIANVYNTQISFPDIGDHTVEATVTDSGGLTGTDSVGIDVVNPNVNNERINPIMGDFNGDALTDLGVFDSNDGKWEIAISDEGVFTNAVDWIPSGFGTTTDEYPIGGDFNGDGLTDVGIYHNTNGECRVALSTGTTFTINSTPWLDFADASYDWRIFMGSFNGDKYTDIGFYNDNTGEWRVALSNGSSFAAPVQWLSNFGGSDVWTPLTGDFNGDGLGDICIFKKSTGEFKVAFSTTASFIANSEPWITGFAVDKDTVISDFNDDGLTDIGYWNDQSPFDWHYAISTGDGFEDKGVWIESFGTTSDDAAFTADFDGNGVTDAAVFDREDMGIERWTVLLSQLQRTDLLVSIDNGIGGITTVEYDYASQYENELLPFPVYVAKVIATTDTIPQGEPEESYSQTFSYAGGYYDAEEREFRGFEKVTVTDPITENRTETYYYQGKENQHGALKGQIEKVLSYDGNDLLITQTLNTWEVVEGGPSSNMLGFPKITEVNTTTWAENGSLVNTRGTFEYDDIGNVLEQANEGNLAVQGDEKIAESTYAPAYEEGFNRLLQGILRDSQGNIITQKDYEYDEVGNLVKQTDWLNTDPDNSPYVEYAYDDFGKVLTTTNALSQVNTTTYETVFEAFPHTVTNNIDQTLTYEYDPRFGVATSMTDVNNVTTTTEYDNLGRRINERDPDGIITTSYSYPDFNTKVTTQLNFEKTEYIDGLSRNYKVVSSGEDGDLRRDISSERIFNARGFLESESLPHYIDEVPSQISYTRYEYDLRGRVVETMNDFPGTLKDATSIISYVSVFETDTVDPRGKRKGTIKDIFDNTVEIIEYVIGGEYHTNYEYDIQGNLLKVTDAQNNEMEMTYDSLGRKLTMDDPDMGHWSYEFDALGRLLRQTDAKGQVLESEYDDLNRAISKKDVTNPASPITLATYEYDYVTSYRIGRLSKAIDQSGSTEFFYDNRGREVQSKKIINGTEYDVFRTYDILDRLQTLTYPDSEVVTFNFDANSGLLESVIGNEVYASGITYNAKGQMKNLQYGNNTSTQYTYGPDLRLSHIFTQNQTSTLQDLNYDFDGCGNLSTWTDNLRTNIRTFLYDDLNRLTHAENMPNGSGGYTNYDYQYDSIGNMTYKSDLGFLTYGFGNAGPHAVTRAGGYDYAYDDNGNMVSGRNRMMDYDVENRLMQVVDLSGTTQFVYDGNGGRIKKTAPMQTTTYVGNLYEIQTTAGQNPVFKKHIIAGQNKIATIETQQGQEPEIYYFHSDHLGSSNIMTDDTGAQVQRCEYAPYGNLVLNEGLDVTNYKFTGKELDNTGLYFYSARYYDPLLGRFIQPDSIIQSIDDPQTLNRYTYCRDNPLKYTDPTGHWFWIAFIIGALIGAVSAGMQSGWNAKAMIAGAVIGAVSGVLGAGVGGLVTGALGEGLGSTIIGSMVGGAVAGAAAGGMSAAYYGGDVGKGMLLGAGFGALGGLVFGSVSQLGISAKGSSWQWDLARVGLSGISGGGISELAGGDFLDGFMFAATIAGCDFIYRAVLRAQGYELGAGIDTAEVEGGTKGKNEILSGVYQNKSNVGVPDNGGQKTWFGKICNFFGGETGPVMNAVAKNVPVVNRMSFFHDPLMAGIRGFFWGVGGALLNFPTMPPSFAITAMGAPINQQPALIGTFELYGEGSNY